MKTIKTVVFVLIGLTLAFQCRPAHAGLEINNQGDLVETTEDGAINWTANRIHAKGCAQPDQSIFCQKASAEVLARTNLLKILDRVHINSERIVREGRLKGLISTEKIEGYLHHSRVSLPKKNSLGLLEVTAYVYLDRAGRSVLLPPEYLQDNSAGVEKSDLSGASNAVIPEPSSYTGLIIDARDLDIRPALLPKILTKLGDQEIYRPLSANRESILGEGFCGYAGSITAAKKTTDRVGVTPMIIRAEKVASNGVDLFVDSDDAVRILDADRNSGILENCRIMIVVDPSKNGAEE